MAYSGMIGHAQNLLPRDGEACHVAGVIDLAHAQRLVDTLLTEAPWQDDEIMMCGMRVVTARKGA